MKSTLYTNFEDPIQIGNYSPLLIDSNVLIGISHEEIQFRNIRCAIENWRKLNASSAIFVPDFIKIEAFNAERYHYSSCTIRKWLKKTENSPDGFYVELKTPVSSIQADQRAILLDLFPRRERLILRNYPELSGTDISLLAVYYYMFKNGIKATLYSMDKKMMSAAEELRSLDSVRQKN
jgi:hypothetical protein